MGITFMDLSMDERIPARTSSATSLLSSSVITWNAMSTDDSLSNDSANISNFRLIGELLATFVNIHQTL